MPHTLPLTTAKAGFFRAVLDTFLTPAAAFAALHQRRAWGGWALLLVTAAQMLALWLFIAPMPADWLVAQQMQQMGELSGSERQQVELQLQTMAPHLALITAGSAALMMALVVLLLGSAYWLLAVLFVAARATWGDWLRLAAWCQLPSLLQSLAVIVVALVSAPERPLALTTLGSLNQLGLHWSVDHPGYAWASTLTLFVLWSALLAICGWRVCTGCSWLRASVLALVPYLLVFGLWGALV